MISTLLVVSVLLVPNDISRKRQCEDMGGTYYVGKQFTRCVAKSGHVIMWMER